jgi:hypothetical protein
MPYRAYHVMLGVVGIVAIGILWVLRANLDLHAHRGPRWKQRLVNAGLLLGAALGFGPAAGAGCDQRDPAKSGYSYPEDEGSRQARRRPLLRADKRVAPEPLPPRPLAPRPPAPKTAAPPSTAGIGVAPPRPPAPPTPQPAATAVRLAAPFTLITKSHDEATAIASGAKGRYPFDKAGKERVLRELAESQASCDVLRKAGQLTATEATLMKQRLARLHSAVSGFRHTEFRASCYRPFARVPPASLSLSRLAARLPHLRRLTTGRRLHHGVVKKILAGVATDLMVLQQEREVIRLRNPADRARAVTLAKRVQRQVDRLNKKLQRPPKVRAGVTQSPQWKVFLKAWAVVLPFADGSQRPTQVERRTARKWLTSARQASADLVTAKLLTPAEAEILYGEISVLGRRIGPGPSTKGRITCYKPSIGSPLKESWSRLDARLSILQKMAKQGRISKVVLDRVMPSLQRDLARIAKAPTKDGLIDLSGEGMHASGQPKTVDPFVKKIRALLTRLKRLPTRK